MTKYSCFLCTPFFVIFVEIETKFKLVLKQTRFKFVRLNSTIKTVVRKDRTRSASKRCYGDEIYVNFNNNFEILFEKDLFDLSSSR